MQNILVAGERLVLRTGMSKDEFTKANIIHIDVDPSEEPNDDSAGKGA